MAKPVPGKIRYLNFEADFGLVRRSVKASTFSCTKKVDKG